MADNLKVAGLRLVIEGAAEFNNTIGQINSKIKLSSAEFEKLQAQYGKNSKNVELLAGKQKLLQDKLQASKDIGKQYNAILEETVAKYGENSAEADKVRTAIAKNEAEQIKLEKQLEAVNKELAVQSSAWTQVGEKAQKVGQKFTEVGDKMVSAGTKLVAVGGAVLGALGGIAVSAGLAADDLNTLSAQTGISTEQLQKFAYASDLIDVDLNTLTKSYAKLTKQMDAAKGGTGSAAEAFATLGVSVTDANGSLRDNEDVFADVIRALGTIENETERDALAMTIFGKSAQDLNPLILGGADALEEYGKQAEELGLVMSQDTLDSLNRFNDVLDSTKAKFKAAKNVLGAKIVDALSPYFDKITGAIDKFITKLTEIPSETVATIAAIAGVVTGLGALLVVGGKITGGIGKVLTVFGKAATAIGSLAGAAGGFGAVLTALGGPVGAIIAALGLLTAAVLLCNDAYGSIEGTLKKAEKAWDKVTKAKEKAFADGKEEITNIQTLKLELDSLVDANGRVKEGYEERAAYIAGELSKATGMEIEMVDGVIQSYDELGAAIDEYVAKRRAEIALEAGEEAYKAAIEGRKNIEKAYVDSYEAMLKAQDDYNNAAAGRDQAEAAFRLANATQLYEDLESQYNEYGEEIKNYETDLAAFRNGKYDEVASGLSGLLVSMEQFTNMSREQQEQQVKDTETAYNEKIRLYQLTGDETTKIQADALAQQLKDEQDYLANRESKQKSSDAELKREQTQTQNELQQASSKHYSTEESNETTHLNKMVTNISNQRGPALSATQEVTGAVSGELSSVENKSYNWGWNAISGFIQGIRDRKRGVADAAAEIAQTVADYIGHNSPAKKGPGRFIVKWGANAIKAWLEGMASMQPKLEEMAASMSSAAMTGLSGGTVSTTTDNRSYSYGGITVQNMVVRSETDIKLIAQELYKLQVKNARGRGVVA